MTTGLLWSVLDDAARMQREMDRVLSGVAFRGRRADANLGQDEQNLYVELAVPGLTPEDIQVSFEDGVLRVASEGRKAAEDEKIRWHRRERSNGAFAHRFRIPVDIQADSISADYKHGILTVTLPKTPAAQPKQISVKVTN